MFQMNIFPPPPPPAPSAPPAQQATDPITCPQCGDPVLIEKINCGIFRHAVFRETGQQIDPHASEAVCRELIQQEKIWGCGRPFQILQEGDGWVVRCCDYI